jgi:hypothetical protein
VYGGLKDLRFTISKIGASSDMVRSTEILSMQLFLTKPSLHEGFFLPSLLLQGMRA